MGGCGEGAGGGGREFLASTCVWERLGKVCIFLHHLHFLHLTSCCVHFTSHALFRHLKLIFLFEEISRLHVLSTPAHDFHPIPTVYCCRWPCYVSTLFDSKHSLRPI